MSNIGFQLMNKTNYSSNDCLEERTFFRWMSNRELSKRTDNRFDGGSPEGGHPVFVLRRVERHTFKFCPCTSKQKSKTSFIIQGSRTKPDGIKIDCDSYILHSFCFNMADSDPLLEQLESRGLVDEEDIIGNFHNKRGGK